ncbi:MAG: flagellar filament capping protein FliD [Candidatus Cloacimonetes bacterium]|nr:flagellar filament capping protein FliD [Candidatus Cloacimonadota bacterium]
MSGTITFSGLASGIDFDAMVVKLVEAEKFQANRLELWKTEWQEKTDNLEELRDKLTAMRSAMDILSSSSTFFVRSTASSNDDVASIAVDSTASPGSYNLTVATSTKHVIGTQGYADDTSAVLADATEQITIDVGAESYTVDGTGGKSLADIRDEINANMTGVTASIEQDGSSNNDYRLVITSATSGSAGEVSVTQTNTDLFDKAIDDVEVIDDLSGASDTPTSGGTYTGHVSKRFVFEVIDGGTVGSSDVEVKWTDSVEGTSGTITITGDGTYDVTQGVQLTFTGGDEYKKGATFAVDVFASTIQAARDNGLAQAEKEVHSGFSDADTTAVTTTDATFSYSYAGNAVFAINVAAGTTLQGLADLINNDPDNPGVKATIINDGSGAANAYHLVLTGEDTGAPFQIDNIDYSSFSAGSFSSGSFSETQTAANAMVKIDGYPAGDRYVQSASNLLTDLVDGASITLKSSGSTEFTISDDVSSMVDKVQAFVDSYNEVMTYINDITKVVLDDDGEAEIENAGAMAGNYGIFAIESKLKNFMVSRAEAFEDGIDPYILLAQVGITTTDDGLLDLDQETLADAIGEDADALVGLFTADKEGVTTHAHVSYDSGTGVTQPGEYHFKIVVDAAGLATSGVYWKDGETEADGRALTVDGTGKFLTATTGDAKGMALQVSGLVTSDTLEGTVRIKEGKAHEFDDMMDAMLNLQDGTIKVLTRSYENIMENIDIKIERELKRVQMVENRYRARFANLEVTLSNYNSQMESLQSELAKLPSI